ncbi:ABC transporter substrate-binding protein [uncultured Sphaerochaeta sp.]|uniref:ABC transporter substrate-binding protein n=1 Tax=uncultured Sphaerochaeta sp. TaxID=886478 RepID=UPI002A0A4C5C|nr:ABC transporter substrate-binding protein [uncultured Sphaerochaeta sp.]
MKKLLIVVCLFALAISSLTATGVKEVKSNEVTVPSVVRTNIGSEPDSLDPWKSAATDTEAIFHNVFEGLMLYDTNGKMIPGLAESVVISPDGLTYTFKLRKNVLFHNDKPFSSADVLYTYNNLTGMSGEKAVSSKFALIKNINAPDAYTFVITLLEPSAAFLSLTSISIVPEGYINQAEHPVGTGPYRFVEYTPGQRIVLERNDAYYDTNRMPKVKRAEIYIMTDESAIVSALQSGQLDFASITAEDAKQLSSDYTIYNSPQNMVQIFALNNEDPIFSDVRVRQAVNYALNKQDVIDGVFGGYATKLDSNFSPVMGMYYNDTLSGYYKHDLAKAKQLLVEAGYPNGFKMTITVPSNYQSHIDTAQIFAQQLAAIGIKATIQPVEWATWLDQVYAKAQYQSTIIGLTGKLDPDSVLGRYTTTYPRNFFKFSNARFDELIAKAKVETNDASRISMYKECQKILTENAAAVYVCDPNLTVAARKDLKGYVFYPVGFMDLSKLYFEE